MSAQPQPNTIYETTIRGFTLIELLVVISIVGILVSLMLPTIGLARGQARAVVCASNAKQLALANHTYAVDNADYFVLAAQDVFADLGGGRGGHWRWHGYRDAADAPFDPTKGPMADYLGTTAQVKACPSYALIVSEAGAADFELGSGGYGYNYQYIGGRNDLYGFTPRASKTSARSSDIISPSSTIMFADAGIAKATAAGGGVGGGARVAEYSFIEPPYTQVTPGPPSGTRPAPSIHFRHNHATANAAWSDGHVDRRSIVFSHNSYGLSPEQTFDAAVGWFGPDNNSLFTVR